MLKILIIPPIAVEIPPRKGGGIEVAVWQLAKYLSVVCKYCEVHVVTIMPMRKLFVKEFRFERLIFHFIPVPQNHNYGIGGVLKYIYTFFTILIITLRIKPHIINVHYNIYSLIIAMLSKIINSKLVVTVHVPYVKPHHVFLEKTVDRIIGELILWSEKLSLKYCRSIVVTSKFNEKAVKRIQSNSKDIIHIPLAASCDVKDPTSIGTDKNTCDSRDVQRFVVGYIGRITAYKRVHRIILATYSLLRKGMLNKDELRIVIAGQPEKYGVSCINSKYLNLLNKLIKIVKRLGLDIVFVPRRLSEQEKNRFYADLDVYIHPSISEGFGLTVSEAVCFGAVPLVAKYDALPEHIPPSLHSLLVIKPDSIEELAYKIYTLYRLHKECKLRRINKQIIEFLKLRNWHNIALSYLKIFMKTLIQE